MEEKLSPQESLQVIEKMIGKVKASYHDTGIGPILWGVVIAICSIVSYLAISLNMPKLFWVWMLTFVAVVPQIMISIKEKKDRKYVSLTDEINAAIWTTFGFSMFVLTCIISIVHINLHPAIYMLVYGIPTIITGWVNKFKPMLIGGILCWILAIASTFFTFPTPFLLMAVAAIVAWLIPGIILNLKYRKQKAGNV